MLNGQKLSLKISAMYNEIFVFGPFIADIIDRRGASALCTFGVPYSSGERALVVCNLFVVASYMNSERLLLIFFGISL